MSQLIALILFIIFFIGLATIAGLFRRDITTPISRPKYKHVRHGWWTL